MSSSVLVLVDPDEREALLEDDRCYVPAYLGASGWIGVDLADDTDWDEINELLDASYRVRPGRAGSPCSTPAPLTADETSRPVTPRVALTRGVTRWNAILSVR